ncbi:MAG: hypothetical protein WCB31_03670 [Nitrososphaeraceae archaeon]
MSDREKPDYRNSIKESISEVESLCVRITRNKKDVSGQALNYVKENPNNIKISIPESK